MPLSAARILSAALLLGLAMTEPAAAASAPGSPAARPDQLAFRELYRELVETNTSHSVGSCTLAAQRMAARLRAAGFAESDLHAFAVPEHPKDGGLVAVLQGSNRTVKAILLLAHLDVVEARREDWTRDPFTLVEEGGYFYGRGTFDDKSMAAVWVDTLIRLRQEGFRPKRTIKMALTCGEEAGAAFVGAEYLVKHERQLIDAAFALNEFAYGVLDAQGHRVVMEIEAGEKTDQDYRLEVVNPGGHSSRPVKDNAIYHLAAGLTRLSEYEFPVQTNDTTRGYFSRMSSIVGGESGVAMMATPVAASGGEYGHGLVWLWGSDSLTPGKNPDAAFGIPADTFWMEGHDGQIAAIIPSRELVIVRLGLTPSRDHFQIQPLVKAILDATK